MSNLERGTAGGLSPAGDAATRGPLAIIAGIAFLALFIFWIPIYSYLQGVTGNNEVVVGLLSALFWLLIFTIVLVAARWSHTVFSSWSTRDLLFVAVVGAVFGPLFAAWTAIYKSFAFLGPWNDLVGGFWWLPAIFIPYVIRKPGAALLGETLAALVSVLAGSPYGFLGAALAGLTQGMGAEVIFMLTGWRRYDWLTLSLAGIASAVTGFVYLWPIYYTAYSADLLIITVASYVVGVLVFAVVGGRLLANALLATGVLDRFAIGRERLRTQETEF